MAEGWNEKRANWNLGKKRSLATTKGKMHVFDCLTHFADV